MARPEGRIGARVALGVAVLAAAALLGRGLWLAESLPEGPVPVPFDRAACARCRMLVSDPRFAAQLQTRDGDVLFFDDPGDLLLYVDERAPDVHAIYFHHVEDDRWIPRARAAFVLREPTPMGYGLGAVERGEVPEALSFADALAHVRAREAERS